MRFASTTPAYLEDYGLTAIEEWRGKPVSSARDGGGLTRLFRVSMNWWSRADRGRNHRGRRELAAGKLMAQDGVSEAAKAASVTKDKGRTDPDPDAVAEEPAESQRRALATPAASSDRNTTPGCRKSRLVSAPPRNVRDPTGGDTKAATGQWCGATTGTRKVQHILLTQ